MKVTRITPANPFEGVSMEQIDYLKNKEYGA
jgi:hypothetical protein